MATTHTITTDVEVPFSGTDPTETEYAYPKIEIEYSFIPAAKDNWNKSIGTWEPGHGAEVDIVAVRLVDGDGVFNNPEQFDLDRIAEQYLDSDDGYQAMIDNAMERPEP